jgi:hypothetical protein
VARGHRDARAGRADGGERLRLWVTVTSGPTGPPAACMDRRTRTLTVTGGRSGSGPAARGRVTASVQCGHGHFALPGPGPGPERPCRH